ncbi:MAG: S8 family serine peptidase [Pseudomonadota bacterium]
MGNKKVEKSVAAVASSHCNRAVALAAMALCGMPLIAQAAPPTQSSDGPWIQGRVLVMPRAGLSDAELGKILKVHGGQARRIGNSDLHVVELPANASEKAVAAQLAHNPHLKFAELDQIVAPAFVPNDPYYGSAWHLSKLNTAAAWETAQGSGVTIAILDTGVDSAHPDLASRIVPGWNFYDNNSNTSDVNGHGTAVAGAAAAASNNSAGVASVAGQAKIMPVRIASPTAYASWSTLAEGITYAADKGARIANISYSGMSGSATVQSAAQYMKNKGGLVFVAAGNSGTSQSVAPTTTMIVVSATDSTDKKTSWSNYGSFVSLSSPGINIYSTSRGGGYGLFWGTSLATPVSAGVAALVMSAKPSLSGAQVESLLFSTAVDLGTAGRDTYFGHGRVNAGAAVQAALGTATVTADTTAPSVSISAPLGSSTVSGLVPVNVNATDNVGVSKVELRVNGATVATDSSTPFAFSWNSANVGNGMHSLVAVAFDAAGNSKASTTVSVNVSNTITSVVAPVLDITAPSVKLINPIAGSKVSGNVSISASATDNAGSAGIAQVLYIDGVMVKTATGGSLSHTWSARKASAGGHTIKVVAKDKAGNSSTTSVLVYK